jgi:putative transcriptional regulator
VLPRNLDWEAYGKQGGSKLPFEYIHQQFGNRVMSGNEPLREADDFERLIASLGDILALTDDSQSPSGSLTIPDTLDAAAIRHKTGLSQVVFARRIGVSVRTVRRWEQWQWFPKGPARVLLALLDRNPRIIEETLGNTTSTS